jgi:Fur family ferric uptake transcriptional regulator
MPNSSLIHTAQNLLRNAKVRVTDARLDVLGALLEKQRALTHTEMQDALPALDRVTLYRALDCLVDAGLAHKITGEDRVFRFSTGNDLSTTMQDRHIQHQHQHGHFTCTQCGQVHCLDSPEDTLSLKEQLHASLEAISLKGFQSHDIEVTIKGWCQQCVLAKK